MFLEGHHTWMASTQPDAFFTLKVKNSLCYSLVGMSTLIILQVFQ